MSLSIITTPPRINRPLVCPPAPKRSLRDKIRDEMVKKDGEMREKMMASSVGKLAYMKMMKDITFTIPSSSDEAKKEAIAFFESKISILEIDVKGLPRYSYTLYYSSDRGDMYREPTCVSQEFNTPEEVINFINMRILTEDDYFINDTYRIPSLSNINTMMGEESKYKSILFDINVTDDEHSVPIFKLNRTRINY